MTLPLLALYFLSLTGNAPASAADFCALNAKNERTLCSAALNVEKWTGTEKKPSPEIIAEIKKNLGLIVVALPSSVFDRENKKVSIDGLGTGTAFAVRLPQGLVWATVAHLTYHLKNEKKILLFTPNGANEANLSALITSGAVADVPASAIREDSFHPFIGANEPGSDFAYFDHKSLTMMDEQPWDEVSGLTLRDLVKDPLKLQEPIYFAGYQKNKYKMFDCSYRGLSQDNFGLNKLSFMATCNNEDFALSGFSGGVFFDQEGLVIGTFTGFMDAFINGAPIYAHKGPSDAVVLRPYPLLKNEHVSQACCFACYGLSPGLTDQVFLDSEAKNRNACVLRLNGREKKLEFQNAR